VDGGVEAEIVGEGLGGVKRKAEAYFGNFETFLYHCIVRYHNNSEFPSNLSETNTVILYVFATRCDRNGM
jgi:hypothetical protein